ncbi:UNVERIFIED_CONTAM: MFS family permease [Brevibacillus sp. OAP136]
MNQLTAIIKRYDTVIWVRFTGVVLTSVTGFMLRPFLVLYLYDKLGGSVLLPMIVIGLQPLIGMLVGWWGGGWTDRFGRKPLMMAALIIQALSMAGMGFAESVWQFAALAIMNGLGMSLFFPAANAQVTDVVPEEKRAEVFALLHTALNVGSAVGPMLGMLVFKQNPTLVFGIASAAFLAYAIILWRNVPETLPVVTDQATGNQAKPSKLVLSEHRPLLWFTVLAVPISLLYAQMESVFPLHLRNQTADYQTIFATLMSINGTSVILFQMWIVRWTQNASSMKIILISYMLLAVVAVGYGFAPFFGLLVAVELLFTLAEMLVGPHMQKVVSSMAPQEMRGRYFSIYGMSWQIARAIGPSMGGLLFTHYGGQVAFSVFSALLLVAGVAQYALLRSILAKSAKTEVAG